MKPYARRVGSITLALRRVEPGDEPFLCAVYASSREEELSLTGWHDAEKETFVAMQFNAQQKQYGTHFPDADFLIILADGREAGRLYLHRREEEIRIVDITLLPEFRNKGIGTALLRDIMAEGDASSKPVTIHVEIFNPALRLYEKLGFRKIEDKGVYHLMGYGPAGDKSPEEKGIKHG